MSARVRCAIYTRKSTEEGLDQEFNTLDAQREACEAYICSQAGEGWKALSEHYDDGGFSGGNLDRPAMQKLLADIDAGKIDVIVVYKVDRLTRSLMDFAKIVERLDARGVSFVSVTQAFNTTTSMGRLTLNVLLSFAQFEREVTGERIRDKIAASKAKGMWMGGNVPFGYDLSDRRLLINPTEAGHVGHIFNRYLELRSGVKLARELKSAGIVSKRWISRGGKERGGQPFSCGALYYLLQNRIYVGEVCHRGQRHKGDHEAIVTNELFDAVQAAIAENRRTRRDRPTRSAEKCPLAGRVCDARGEPLTTSFSYGRAGRLYRYYVAGSLDPLRTGGTPPLRVPAGPLERLVQRTVSQLLQTEPDWDRTKAALKRIELHGRSIQLVLQPDAVLEPGETLEFAASYFSPRLCPATCAVVGSELRIIVDQQPSFRGGETRGAYIQPRTIDAHSAAAVLREAHRLLQEHLMSPFDACRHHLAAAPVWQRQRRMMALGLLSPSIQKTIVQGTFEGSLDGLLNTSHPLAWADQVC
jgi:DNA invertase Pin-like site-specific DNA recombinase